MAALKNNDENWEVYTFATKAEAVAKMTEIGFDREPFKKNNKWHIHFDFEIGKKLDRQK